MRNWLGVIATLVATASLAGSAPSWEEFWHSVKVDPVPPVNFIDVPAFRGKPGELHWQLDTGHFFTHPVLGPLWYQQTGFTCIPDDGTRVGEICARVKP